MLKRTIDIAVAATLLLVFAPLFALIAVAVILDSGWPALFSQIRVGRRFRPFHIYKFRSMLASLSGAAITAGSDPRITRVGRLLRATKLDELPQLWNVLRGDMSLVGPRPEIPPYVEAFRRRYERILELRPGITDLASIRFRDEEQVLALASDPLRAYEEDVLPAKLDLADEYFERRSLWLDVSILCRTLRVCFGSHLHMSIKQGITKVLDELERRGRDRVRRPLVWCVQIAIFALSGVAAFLLRFDYAVPPREVSHLSLALPVWLVVKSVVFRRAKQDSGWWRFISIFDVAHLALVNFAASMLSAIPIALTIGSGFPRSIYALDLLLCFLATAGVRILFRVVIESARGPRPGGSAQRVVVYGAGNAGVMLLRETRAAANGPYQVCGFVDDNPAKKNHSIQGVRVWGAGAQLAELARKHKIGKILIAIPSASGPQMTQILNHCHKAGVPYMTVPSLTELMKQQGIAKHMRNVAVEDLLGRSPVCLDEDQVRKRTRDRVVLITGAGGSIGSELCRQLASFQPRAIVGFDTSENALFQLDLEMRERFPEVPFHPEIGSIQNASRFAEVLHTYHPSLLYHAAAYKHVPLLESHVVEAVENNVLATATVARLASQYGVEDFVMISTDKAVRPTSLLGATKRVAELVVNSFNGTATKYVSVRFGNVLGSNGSVIPVFKKQIAAGGPVTVTHPGMHRYFMTIPEAVQLVLQASTMGRGGEIFVLDMGQPVKILDLAHNLIILSGLRPDEDIKIVFSGLRPGEKLHEELTTADESTVPTTHEKIKVFRGLAVQPDEIWQHLRALEGMCKMRDVGRLILGLKEIVPEYNPGTHLLRQAMQMRPETASLVALAQSVGFSSQQAPEMQASLQPQRTRSDTYIA